MSRLSVAQAVSTCIRWLESPRIQSSGRGNRRPNQQARPMSSKSSTRSAQNVNHQTQDLWKRVLITWRIRAQWVPMRINKMAIMFVQNVGWTAMKMIPINHQVKIVQNSLVMHQRLCIHRPIWIRKRWCWLRMQLRGYAGRTSRANLFAKVINLLRSMKRDPLRTNPTIIRVVTLTIYWCRPQDINEEAIV